MGFPVRLQPQNFHPPQHARIEMTKLLPSEGLPYFVREFKPMHPCTSSAETGDSPKWSNITARNIHNLANCAQTNLCPAHPRSV